jgi:hypothetical protein
VLLALAVATGALAAPARATGISFPAARARIRSLELRVGHARAQFCGDLDPNGHGDLVADVHGVGVSCSRADAVIVHTFARHGTPQPGWRCSYARPSRIPGDPSVCVRGQTVVGWYGEAP